MNFSDLNLKKDYLTNTSTFKINEQQIEVKKYLPISDKNDLITISLQKAEENGYYNEVLLDVYFHLNIVYLYTDIDFSAEDREDELALYDMLETNNIIDIVISNIGEEEYNNLRELLVTTRDMKLKYENSAAAVLNKFVTDLPKNAAVAADIVNSFDKEKYSEVANFAAAANGGRNIFTNMPMTQEQETPIKPSAASQIESKEQPPKKILSVESAVKKD